MSSAAEKDLEVEKLESFLEKTISDPTKHALWLNTLSLLEHIGSRKILMTQSNEQISEMVLRHATEEARHALFFKKAARKIMPDLVSGYHQNELLQGRSSKFYFSKLDVSVRTNLKKCGFKGHAFKFLCYLYTTTVIESRAMIVYNSYNHSLNRHNHTLNLSNLILEEEGHLNDMSSAIKEIDHAFETRMFDLLAVENKLFRKLLNSLTLAVA